MITHVHKFGGSLMGNGKLLTNVIKNIKNDKINNIKPIFVVSALNPSADKKTGTTTLLEKAYTSNNTDKDLIIDEIYKIHNNLLGFFGLSISKKLNNLFNKINRINIEDHTVNDMIEFGELLSAHTLNDILDINGINSKVGKIDDDLRNKEFSFATSLDRSKLLNCFKKNIYNQYLDSKSTIFPGFFILEWQVQSTR